MWKLLYCYLKHALWDWLLSVGSLLCIYQLIQSRKPKPWIIIRKGNVNILWCLDYNDIVTPIITPVPIINQTNLSGDMTEVKTLHGIQMLATYRKIHLFIVVVSDIPTIRCLPLLLLVVGNLHEWGWLCFLSEHVFFQIHLDWLVHL